MKPSAAIHTLSRRQALRLGVAGTAAALGGRFSALGAEKPPSTPAATLNIADFGAAPSRGELNKEKGVFHFEHEVDCTKPIQAAIDSLPPYDEKTGMGGGVVVVPHGEFLVSDTIVLPPAVVLRGQGLYRTGSTLFLKSGIWRDRSRPKPMIETRHPRGITHSVPYVGIDSLEIAGMHRDLDTFYAMPTPAQAQGILNPGAILVLWRGGLGSFIRNTDLWGGMWGNLPKDGGPRHALLIPPECHAGPTMLDGVDFDASVRPLKISNAHGIFLNCPTWGCMSSHGEPMIEMTDCSGVVIQNGASETSVRFKHLRSQAAFHGLWSGWNGGTPCLENVDSQVSALGLFLMNRKVIACEVTGQDIEILEGPGGAQAGLEGNKMSRLSFYGGAHAVVPGKGNRAPIGRGA